jgi:hypothetical protein
MRKKSRDDRSENRAVRTSWGTTVKNSVRKAWIATDSVEPCAARRGKPAQVALSEVRRVREPLRSQRREDLLDMEVPDSPWRVQANVRRHLE